MFTILMPDVNGWFNRRSSTGSSSSSSTRRSFISRVGSMLGRVARSVGTAVVNTGKAVGKAAVGVGKAVLNRVSVHVSVDVKINSGGTCESNKEENGKRNVIKVIKSTYLSI